MSFFEPVAATARRQHGLITRAQLDATGLTDRKVRTLVEHGTLVRKRRGLYVIAGAPTATVSSVFSSAGTRHYSLTADALNALTTGAGAAIPFAYGPGLSGVDMGGAQSSDFLVAATPANSNPDIAAKGLILTEFAPGTKPEGPNFPHRNRIVSGLSLGVLVVEGALGSGSLITASLALAQNRDVFALPGPANLKTYQGCHQLIRQGACLVQSGEDILRELDARLRPFALPRETVTAPDPVLPENPDQRAMVRLLDGRNRAHVDVLTRELGWPSEKVCSTLLLLELQGLVEQLPGMYYALLRT